MPYFRSSTALAVALAALAARADVVPTAPWGGVVDKTGSACDIQWNLDTTGTWTDVSIFLMTGSNQNFVQLAEVASGIDGTTGEGKYSWTCPEVSINAPIYFYAFSNNGAPVSTWTTRFTIANAAGNTVPAPEATQPDGSAIPWGAGKIVGGTAGGASSGSGSSASSGSSAGGSSAGSQGISSAASVSRTSGASSSAPVTTPSSSATDDGTTVITVTPASSSSTGRMTTTSRNPLSTGVGANANNNTTSNNNTTGAASSSHGSVAGLGLVLAVLAGLTVA